MEEAGWTGLPIFKKRIFGNKNQQKEYVFHPHTFSKQQYVLYASTKERIIQNIQKGWEGGYDIGISLRDLVVFDLTTVEPIRATTTKTDQVAAQREQEGMNIKYQEQLRFFRQRGCIREWF